jgi:hydrogenase maturation protease
MRILIIGIGNLLLGDEGIGIHVIQHLQQDPELQNIDILDGGTGGFRLLNFFLDHDLVVIMDAALDQKAPGTVTRLEPKYTSDYPRTLVAHDIGLKDILDALELMEKKPKIVLFTVSIAKLDRVTLDLSPTIRDAILPAAEKVKNYIQSLKTSR